MAKKTEARADTEDRTAAQDENAGLAGRLLELRALVEEHRKLAVRDRAEQMTLIARLEQRVAAVGEKIDKAQADWDRRSRELDQTQRDAGEQVRKAGEIARQMSDKVRVLDELRAVASDPHDVVKPIRKELGQIHDDLRMLRQHVDLKFEGLGRPRSAPVELRGDAPFNAPREKRG